MRLALDRRSSFVLADYERKGGVAKRMSPLATVSDCGALLQACMHTHAHTACMRTSARVHVRTPHLNVASPRLLTLLCLTSPHLASPCFTLPYRTLLHQAAGFSLPTVDTDKVVVHYPDAWTLFHHLRAMGDSHAVLDRSASSQETLLAASAAYREMYADTETSPSLSPNPDPDLNPDPNPNPNPHQVRRRRDRRDTSDLPDDLPHRLGAARVDAEADVARLGTRTQ